MPVPAAIANMASGAAFGAALTMSGIYMPSIISSQMRLTNFDMLETFFAASIVCVLVIQLATSDGYCPPQTRSPTSVAGLAPYSGNIIGGLLFGASMALVGACPGTVIVQCVLGVRSAVWVVLGGLIGGIAFAGLAPSLKLLPASTSVTGSGSTCTAVASPAPTFATKLSISNAAASTAYITSVIAAILLSIRFAPVEPLSLNPFLGGLTVGIAQVVSVLLRRKAIGVSDVYTDIGRKILHFVVPSTKQSRPSSKSLPAVWFAVGIALGAEAVVLAKLVPTTRPALDVRDREIGKMTALLGGATLVVGAHVADGCTSGHGISGMSTFSLASYVTIAAIFAGGIALEMLAA